MRMSDWSSDVCSSDLTPSAWLCTARHPDRPDQARPFQRVPEEDVRPDPERPADGSCPKQADLHTVQAQIGRASGRERRCQYVSTSGVAVPLKKKTNRTPNSSRPTQPPTQKNTT